MKSVNKIFDDIEKLLPKEKVIKDIIENIFIDDEIEIELENSSIRVDKNIDIDIIAYVVQYGPFGEHSEFRITIGLGGVKYKYGLGLANICFGRIIYDVDLNFGSISFYSMIS